jgi:hypothetical protein
MDLDKYSVEAINERIAQRRREACEKADAWDMSNHGWNDDGDYIVVLCPKCKKRTAARYDRSDGLPESVEDNCDNCEEEFELKVEWEIDVRITHVEFAQRMWQR